MTTTTTTIVGSELSSSSLSSSLSSSSSTTASSHHINDLSVINKQVSDEDDDIVYVDRCMTLSRKGPPATSTTSLPHSGERSVHTSIRLQHQGFISNKSKFAMKSIAWGSDEWNVLLRPFVADLVFRSLQTRRFQNDRSFHPYTGHAVVLFVDISNYSQITAKLAHLGSHTISTIVNDYFSRLLRIATQYGGDIVKFAGDAVLIVWEGSSEEIEHNLLLASKCVLEMQEKAGTYVIDATKSLYFRIHCALCTGLLESDIFVAPNHINMQKYFHSLSGDSLIEISHLVHIAKAGEVCISSACIEILANRGTFLDIDDHDDCKLLSKVNIDMATNEMIGLHLNQVLSDRSARRNTLIEADFIHPNVLRLLLYSGGSPTQIAQMRNLCVLFIAMTSKGSSVNWLIEVQTILDNNRCPMIQIIDDYKGVHVVAAVNLYESIPESSLIGLAICRDLIGQEAGCAIGMAQGPTFCGVTGCSTNACRWDVMGPPAVRAARLMQYLDVAIDQSVCNDSTMAASQLRIRSPSVRLEGATETIPVYTLSDVRLLAAFRVLETSFPAVHDGLVKRIEEHITNAESKRCVVLVTGGPLTRKKVVCQRAAGYANLVPYLHVSDVSMGFLQLARTVATWFLFVDSEEIQERASFVISYLEKKRWCQAHDKCVSLVDLAVKNDFHLLDDFSVSFIRECLHGRSGKHRSLNMNTSSTKASSHNRYRSLQSDPIEDGNGKICFLCVHLPLYLCQSADRMRNDITRFHTSLNVPIVIVGEATKVELKAMTLGVSGIEPSKRLMDAAAPSSGHCTGYYAERSGRLRNLSSKRRSKDIPGCMDLDGKLEFSIPFGFLRAFVTLPVTRISGEVAMKFSNVYDLLSPTLQTFCKVLTVSARTTFYKLSRTIMWNALNDLIAEGVENDAYDILIDDMVDMHLLKIDVHNKEEVLSLQCPALGDIAFDVCTPIQLRSIGGALIERLDPYVLDSFVFPFVIANLHDLIGCEYKLKEELWSLGFERFEQECQGWNTITVTEWKEMMAFEMCALGCLQPELIMGRIPSYEFFSCKHSISDTMMSLKQYHSPISFGPLGLTFSVITTNLFSLCGEFHGFDAERIHQIRNDLINGCTRYLDEVSLIESFLSQHGFSAKAEVRQDESNMIDALKLPDKCMKDLDRKASFLYDEYITKIVVDRIGRIHMLVKKLREMNPSYAVQIRDETLRLAYEAITSSSKKLYGDRAQDALMIMATRNWKAKPIPESMPSYHLQTLTMIRNTVMKQLSDEELELWKHQQSYIDLEAFLVITSFLQEQNNCTR